MPEIIIKRDPEEMSDEACGLVLAAAARKPAFALGLATGSTPRGLYERLRRAKGAFAKARFFNLDELHGEGPDSALSFHRALREQLLDHVDHDPGNVRFLRGDADDLEAEAEAYEREIWSVGGIDLQILGVGLNGHLGFNEPGSSLGSRTRPKTLEATTLAQYSRGGQGPRSLFVLTMGLGTIMEARRLLVLASGEEKAEIVQRMVEGPVTAEVPASIVQMHPRVQILVDEAAASRLKRRDYWKWVYANKWRVGQ